VGFERLARKHGIIGDIRGKDCFQGIEFVQDWPRKSLPHRAGFVARRRRALANGLLLPVDPNWLASARRW